MQHHVAHVAAIAAEQALDAGRCSASRSTGMATATDGAPWGGELIVLDGARWDARRLSRAARAAGGDKAAREPWRMGVAMLQRLGRRDEAARLFPDIPDAARLAGALQRGARSPMTTSLGRLFDAVAALAGVCLVQHYEGQAAMELEALVDDAARRSRAAGRIAGRPARLSPAMGRDARSRRLSGREAAEAFHGTLIAALAEWIGAAAARAEFDARRARRRLPDEPRAGRGAVAALGARAASTRLCRARFPPTTAASRSARPRSRYAGLRAGGDGWRM